MADVLDQPRPQSPSNGSGARRSGPGARRRSVLRRRPSIRRTGLASAAAFAALGAATATMGSVGTAVAQDGSPVSGTWANTVPLTITSVTPDGSDYDVVGTQGTDWHGSLEGSTTYTATFLFDPVANTSVGTIDETFTGTLAGVGPGTLHLAEQFTQDGQGLVTVDATIVSGTAALATVTGSLHFSGTADMNGIGAGTFSGSLRLPAPTVVPGAVSGPEGDAGTTSLAVPVTLSTASGQPVTVQYTTVHVAGDHPTQADPDTDYTPTTGTVTFAPGQTTATAPIAIHGDTLVEPDEYIIVSFHNATNATIGGFYGLGVATITNDDHAAIVPGAVSGPEGDAGTTSLAVPVTLSHASGQPVTVQYTTVHVAGDHPTQADPDTDYTPTTGTVTFAPGQTTATAPIAIHGDTLVEPDEYIIVSFHNATNATIGGFYGLGVATITNDD